MSSDMETIKHVIGRIKSGVLKDKVRQTIWIYQYAKQYWRGMLFYTLLGLSGTIISIISSYISRDLVNIITGHQTGEVIKTFAFMIGMALSNTIVGQISSYFSNRISMQVDAEIKSDIFSKMLVTDMESISAYHTGDLLTRWASDASNISNGVLSFVPELIIDVFRLLSALFVMFINDASFVIFALVGIPANLLMSRTLMRRMENNNKKSAAMSAKMNGFNQESFSNIQTIKAFNLIQFYIDKLKSLQKEYIDMRLSFQRMAMATSFLLTVVSMVVSYASYGWGIYRVWSGAITYGAMTQFLSLSGTLTDAVNSMISLVPQAISLTISAERLMDIVEMPREDYSQAEQGAVFMEKHRSQGISLVVKDLSYAYHSGTQVFEHVSLEAHPHEIIALVGPSGEGKTTMLRLILALLRPQAGEATIFSGGEQMHLSPSTRQMFSYVPQGNTMFSGTIASNMRNVKPDATDEEIIEALKLSCAWDFVEKLPLQIETELQERGGGLSEGQCQRLSIARALLRKSPILLLDEATSALDVATERKVLRSIMADTYPRTVIVTTHRPTVLNACTRVYSIHSKTCELLSGDEIDRMSHDF